MADLEPASALASSLLFEFTKPDCNMAGAVALIESDRAAVREPLERRVRELDFSAKALSDAVLSYEEETIALKQRIASLEAQLEKTAVDAAETIADLKHTISMHEERIDREQNRIASLEAQLASAREEALREAAVALRDYPIANAEAAVVSHFGGVRSHVTHDVAGLVNEELGLLALRLRRHIEALLTSPPKSPWIPVEDTAALAKLEANWPCAVLIDHGGHGAPPEVGYFIDGEWFDCADCELENDDTRVVYFQPLAPPPEELDELPPPAAQKEHTAQSAMASAVESKLALYTTTEPEKEPHGR